METKNNSPAMAQIAETSLTTFPNLIPGEDKVTGSRYDIRGQHAYVWSKMKEALHSKDPKPEITPVPSFSKKIPANIKKAPYCKIDNCKSCKICKLDPGMTDLCRFKPVTISDPELLRNHPPKIMGGTNPDFWTPSPNRRISLQRDNSRFLGYYDPASVMDALDEGVRITSWEYRAYMENPNTPRRIYVGDDSLIKESELDHYKDGGYSEDTDGMATLITPYDRGIDEDPELNKEFEEQESKNSWKQQGVDHHKVYQHTIAVNRVIVGDYSTRIKKVVYQPERIWFLTPSGKPTYADIETRSEIEYREDTIVEQRQELPTLHPVMIGFESDVIGVSTTMTKKDKAFLAYRRYDQQVIERHRKILIHCDEVKSRSSQAVDPASA
jgi:hypothetical protein